MNITVSGKAWSAGIEVSEISREIGLPKPAWRSVGKGTQALYEVTPDQAEALVRHFDILAGSFSFGDEYTRAEGRACAKAAEVIRRQIKEHGT